MFSIAVFIVFTMFLAPNGGHAFSQEAWLDNAKHWAHVPKSFEASTTREFSAHTTAAAAAAAAAPSPSPSPSLSPADSVRATARALRQCYNIPGLSVSVTVGSKVVLSEGFGEAALGSGARVTAHTAFAIGSITKGMTALLLAEQRAQGMFEWNDPLSNVLGASFVPGADVDTRAAPVSFDVAASHRSGLARYDLQMLAHATKSHAEAQRDMQALRLRNAAFSVPPRTDFTYSNHLYSALGVAAARLGGARNWEALVRERIFLPLGMRRTRATHDDTATAAADDVDAAAHTYRGPDRFDTRAANTTVSQSPRAVLRWMNRVAPAGGVWSTAHDMAKYGAALASPQSPLGALARQELLLARTAIDTFAQSSPSSHFPARHEASAWSRGFQLGHYRGESYFAHGGNTFGHSAFFIVQGNVSVTVLTNLNGQSQMPFLLALHSLDAFKGVARRRWLEGQAACAFPCPHIPPPLCYAGSGVASPVYLPPLPHTAHTASIVPLLTGTFRNRLFGEATVRAVNATHLSFAFAGDAVRGRLVHASNGLLYQLVLEPEDYVDPLPVLFAHDWSGVGVDSFSLFVDAEAPPERFVRRTWQPRSNGLPVTNAANAAVDAVHCDNGNAEDARAAVAEWHVAEVEAAAGNGAQVARIIDALRAQQHEAEEECESQVCSERVEAHYEKLIDRIEDTRRSM